MGGGLLLSEEEEGSDDEGEDSEDSVDSEEEEEGDSTAGDFSSSGTGAEWCSWECSWEWEPAFFLPGPLDIRYAAVGTVMATEVTSL